jgi:uncharacterized membrane protein YgcG
MRRRLLTFLVLAALSPGLLVGCAADPPTLSSGVSSQMQSAVVSIAESAAAGDFPAATAQLDKLQAQLNAALAAGEVTAEKAAAIQEAINLVRADLQPPAPAVEPPTPPTDTGEPSTPVDSGGGDDSSNNSGPGNSGSGNGNGNGNGGGGKGKDK